MFDACGTLLTDTFTGFEFHDVLTKRSRTLLPNGGRFTSFSVYACNAPAGPVTNVDVSVAGTSVAGTDAMIVPGVSRRLEVQRRGALRHLLVHRCVRVRDRRNLLGRSLQQVDGARCPSRR